ncbi:MAG TPA: AAA family ATPase [Kineosporiaceae bacterium]|nr:AAA family ATPase [Kineosporiaceae bacterium]
MAVFDSVARPLLERDREIEQICAGLTASRAGGGRLLVLEGRLGAGKTRLLAETRGLAEADGFAVLQARGGELESAYAFGAVRQLFEPLLMRRSANTRAELFSGAAGAAELVFSSPVPDEWHSLSDPTFPVLHGLYWLLANVASAQPTLVLLDDLHWFDAPSLRWLAFTARRLDGLGVCVVGATRPAAEAADPSSLADVLTDPTTQVLRPHPLGLAAIAALAGTDDGRADEPFCEVVREVTGGNPLFVHALLEAAADHGIAPTAAHAPRLRELAADGVTRLVALRLARLSDRAVRLARAAAVLGDQATVRLTQALAHLAEEDHRRGVAQLQRSGLLGGEDPLRFSHPIVRTAVLADMSVAERHHAHRKAAELLVDAGAPVELAAAHLLSVPAAAAAGAVETLRAAAERALQQGSADIAVAYLTRAHDERIDAATGLEILIELGKAEQRTNADDAASHLAAAIARIEDPERRGELILEHARARFFSGRPREAIRELEDALGPLRGDGHEDLAERLQAELIGAAWWEPDTHRIAAVHLAAIDPQRLHGGLGSDLLLASLATYTCRQGRDRARALDHARSSLASGRLEIGAAGAYAYATTTLLFAGCFDDALSHFAKAVTAARRRGDVVHLAALSLIWRGRTHALKGRLAAAAVDLREAFDLAREHAVDVAVPYIAGFLADVLREQGDVQGAVEVIDSASLPQDLPQNTHLMFFRLARARLRLVRGSTEQALHEATAIGETVAAVPSDNPAVIPWRAVAAEALRQLDRVDLAVHLAEENLALALRWGADYAVGGALCALGRVDEAGAEERFRRAVATLAASPATLEYARAVIELGACLRRGNHRIEARAHLRSGVDLAEDLGARALADRANAELAACGARPRQHRRTGADALTASERRVAQLAAQGMTNKDIAQALFVTVKTVELHLSNAYRKLDISSRREIGRALT